MGTPGGWNVGVVGVDLGRRADLRQGSHSVNSEQCTDRSLHVGCKRARSRTVDEFDFDAGRVVMTCRLCGDDYEDWWMAIGLDWHEGLCFQCAWQGNE